MPTKWRDFLPFGAAALTFVATAVVAVSGVMTTSAAYDQAHFHLPAVIRLRNDFPSVDIVDLPTATGPLYHVVVSALSGPLSLDRAGTQIVGGLFSVALAALTLYSTRGIGAPARRFLASAPLICSAYFWQSAVWMLTDNAAILFAMAATLLLMKGEPSGRREIAIGFLIALAVSTRQSSVWLLAPAISVTALLSTPQHVGRTALACLRVSAPAITALVILVSLWKGLTPPGAGDFNANGSSPVALTYTFAVASIFALPLLLCFPNLGSLISSRIRVASAAGVAAALPAAAFTSGATDPPNHSRRGGPIWQLVAATGDVWGRSPALIALGFIGAFSCVVVASQLQRRVALIMSTSVIAISAVGTAGAQLFQKYAELPLAMLSVLAIVTFISQSKLVRLWPLAILAALQLAMTGVIVVLPILAAA